VYCMVTRKPAVAGMFYEASRDGLINQIKWAIEHEIGPKSTMNVKEDKQYVLSVVAPHAGYVYSGPVAAHAYVEVGKYAKPKVFIIIGPNHYGVGSPAAIMTSGEWETPLGKVEVDEELASQIKARVKDLAEDPIAFEREHSVEVQVPFIQYLFPGSRIVPIVLWNQTIDMARRLGSAISEVVNGRAGEVVLVASSDLNHYEPHEVTTDKDMRVIEHVLNMDEEGFYSAMEKYDVSVCGFGAIMAAIVYSRKQGATGVKLLKHATSGDTSGYLLETVGYASIAFYK